MLQNLISSMNPEKLLIAFVSGMSKEKKEEIIARWDESLALARKSSQDFEEMKHQNADILNKLEMLSSQLPPDEPITETLATIEDNTETLIDLEIEENKGDTDGK